MKTKLWFLFLLVLCFKSNALAGQISFGLKTDYNTYAGPYSVIAADLDGDNKLDLAVANRDDGGRRAVVFWNNGQGVFNDTTSCLVGYLPRSIVVADLNGDGRPDLAVANEYSDSVSILINNGNRFFATKVNYQTGQRPYSVCAADLDVDGDQDLAVSDFSDSTVSILKNNGNGTFASRLPYPTGPGPVSVFAADFDGDGDRDLVVGNEIGQSVSLLRNNGDGTFAPKSDYSAGTIPFSVYAADLDMDGDIDVAVAGATNLSVIKNNGSGTFAAPDAYNAGPGPHGVFPADFDGDGDLDLAVAIDRNGSNDSVSVFENNGTGSFTLRASYPTGSFPISVCAADLDGDGDKDLAVTNQVGNSISVFKNLLYSPLFASHADSTAGGSPYAVVASDFDQDGKIDLAVANYGGTVSILKGLGGGAFASRVNYNTSPSGGVYSISTADIDGNSYPDLMVTHGDNIGSKISVLRNDGNGAFPLANQTSYTIGNDPRSTCASDFDADGDMDFAVGYSYGIATLTNDGNGNFTVDSLYTLPGISVRHVLSLDVDGDGDQDILVANYSGNTISILKNNGGGTGAFTLDGSLPTGDSPHSIVSADFNADGYPDLATANVYGHSATILMNNQNGTFSRRDSTVGNYPFSVFAADFNGDGLPDLVTANSGYLPTPLFSNDSSVSVLINLGNGNFAAQKVYLTGRGPVSVWATDLDGDGDQDLAATNVFDNSISILKNLLDNPVAPEPPIVNAVLDAGTGDKLVVKWSAPLNTSNITEYEIGWGLATNDYPNSKIVLADGHSSYRTVIDGLQPYTRYFVAVRSKNSNAGKMSGWVGAHNPDTAVYATIPVVLVHGICPGDTTIWDDPNSTEDIKRWLEVANFNHIWIVNNLACCGWEGEIHYDSNAVRLSRFIEAKANALESTTGIRVNSIDIVAHSMGGLISRRYISDDDPVSATWAHLRTVRNLIMLGTPNLGTNLGNHAPGCGFLCSGPAERELGQDNMTEFNTKYWKRRGARYYVAWGSGGRPENECGLDFTSCTGWLELSKYFELCPNDGIVWKFSAEIALLDGLKEGQWCHTEYYRDPFLFISFIKPILMGQPITGEMAFEAKNVNNYGSTPQIAITRCGEVEQAQQRSEPMTVEVGGMSILLLATDPNLGFTLESPGGIIWDPARAESDPAVLYAEGPEGKGYVFENVEAGTWLAHIDAQNLNRFSASPNGATSGSVSYSLMVAIQNNVNLQASISEVYPLPGFSIVLTATLTDNSAPLLGAAVSALPIHKGTDTLSIITLLDDGNHNDGAAGDGVYGGIFNQPTDSGLISFKLEATGTSPTTGQFRREASLTAYITLGIPVKGDLNRDRNLTPADVVLELNCVFLGEGNCDYEVADCNCDGYLSPADVVMELNAVFLGSPFPC